MLKEAGTRVGLDVVIHGLLASSLWAHCEAEHQGGENTAKQKAAVMIGLGRSQRHNMPSQMHPRNILPPSVHSHSLHPHSE